MCLFQRRNVRVRIFPQCEELLIFTPAPGGLVLQRIGSSQAEVGEDDQRRGWIGQPGVIREFLKFDRGLGALVRRQIGLAAQIRNRRIAELVGRDGLQQYNSLIGFALPQVDGGAH